MALQAKNRFLVFIFSVVPGLGHYYLGQMNRGFQLMLAFFGSIAIGVTLDMPGIALFIPIVWFYALFDALQMASALGFGETVQDTPVVPWAKLKVKEVWAGWGLIVIGLYLIIVRVVPSIVPAFIYTDYARTIFIAVLLIVGGIRILVPRRERSE